MKISILLAAYKSGELLEKVFDPGMQDNELDVDHEILLWDNGGNEQFIESPNIKITNTEHQLRSYRWEKYFKYGGDGNIGLNAALNNLAKIMKGDYFYLPHTDMRMMPHCISSLMSAAKNHAPTSFLFCSRSIEKTSHIPMQILKDFGTTVQDYKEKELIAFTKEYKDKGIVTGYRMPFFGHRKLLDKLTDYNIKNNICDGPFDESFFSYATDNDLFFNCYDIGVRKFWLIKESLVYHLSGHSNKQQKVDKDDKAPYLRLCNKWKKYNVTMNIDQSEQNLIPWNLKIV